MVDNTMYGIATGGMRLRFLTAASDATEKTEFRLMNSSKGSEAIVVLGDTPYYESLEASMKIRKYVKTAECQPDAQECSGYYPRPTGRSSQV